MSRRLSRFLMVGWVLLLFPRSLAGQLIREFHLPKAACRLQRAAQQLADQLQDWNQLGRYYNDNERLKALPPEPGRVIFLGDSITDGWKLAKFFPGKPYVSRGISGQTTPQMLVQKFPDVIDLRPAAVNLLAGTNDIAGDTGPETLTIFLNPRWKFWRKLSLHPSEGFDHSLLGTLREARCLRLF